MFAVPFLGEFSAATNSLLRETRLRTDFTRDPAGMTCNCYPVDLIQVTATYHTYERDTVNSITLMYLLPSIIDTVHDTSQEKSFNSYFICNFYLMRPRLFLKARDHRRLNTDGI